MIEVDGILGNRWPPIHMMRGIAVAFDYPFASADSTSLAQNGWRYDSPIETLIGDAWRGRRAYADSLERDPHTISVCQGMSHDHRLLVRKKRRIGIVDQLVTRLLTSLGYGEGMAIFVAAVRSAHSRDGMP